MDLVGRSSEREAFGALLNGACEGLSSILVLRGEAGMGKTALLDGAAESAAALGMQIVRLTGIESETQLGYAALHRLLLPYLDHVDWLPGPQRDALRSTSGWALKRLEERTEASGARWGLGRLARCRALLAGNAAEPFYRGAIDLLEPAAALTDLARTHLLYGEWLRRQRRRRNASPSRHGPRHVRQDGSRGFRRPGRDRASGNR